MFRIEPSHYLGFLICFLLLFSGAFALSDNNIKGWWTLDTNTLEVTPDYKSWNDGTAFGAQNLSGGLIGKDYNFKNATDRIDFNETTWRPDKNFSINFWIKTIDSGANRVFNNTGGGGANGLIIDCAGTDNAPRILLNNALVVATSGASNSCDTDNWRMLTFTHDGNSVKVYIDGEFVKDGINTGVTYGGGERLTAGAWYQTGSYSQSMRGQLDEISVYENYVLSQADISYLYNSNAGIQPPFSTIVSDFNYSIDIINQLAILKNTSSVPDTVEITAWTWKLDDSNIAYTQDYNYSTSSLTDLNICLRIDSNIDTSSTTCKKFNTGDWNAPVTVLTKTQLVNQIIQSLSFSCTDNNSGCKWTTFKIGLDDWNTQVNTATLDVNYLGQGTFTLDYYSTDNADNNEAVQSTTFTTTGNPIPPIVYASIPKGFGFTSDFNITFNLQCVSNWLDPLTYDVNLNGLNIWHSVDANGTIDTNWVVLTPSAPSTFVFSCSDPSGNVSTVTANTIYPLLFRLINEDTGVQYTWADLNTNFYNLIAYTPDGNFRYDFNTSGTTQAYYISPASTMIFEITYRDTPPRTIIKREINFSLLADTNVPICVPMYQALYPQRFISNQNRGIILKNNVAGCYDLAGYLTYAYDTGYSQLVYTIPKPYYLYSYDGNQLSLLALLDGTNTIATNLDTLLFARQAVNYTLGNDGVAFYPLINPVTNLADLNTIQVYYKAFYNDNKSIQFQFSYDGNTIFTFSDSNSSNAVVTNFDYSSISGLTDSNYLLLTITMTKIDGTIKTATYYFNIKGNFQTSSQDLGWIAILSLIFFIGGMTMVATRSFLGLYGVLICLVSIFLCTLALGSWWTWLLEVVYVLVLLFIFLTYKPNGVQQYG